MFSPCFPYCYCFVLFPSFILLISKIHFCSFFSFNISSPLNYFICISESRFCVSTIALFSSISNLQPIPSYISSCNPYLSLLFQHWYLIRCLYYSSSCTFVASWFIKLNFYFMSALTLSTCCTNYIIRSIWRSSSNSTFSADFLIFSMVLLLSSKLVWKPYLCSLRTFLAPYFIRIKLASYWTSQLYCSFYWVYI